MVSPIPTGTSGADALTVAVRAARRAAPALVHSFGQTRIVADRGGGDFSTAADLEAERLIVDAISFEFPNDRVMAEEAAHQLAPTADSGDAHPSGGGNRIVDGWVVDALDGTRSFSRSIPFFSISVALVGHGRPILGVVYDPLRDEMFHAVRGRGVRLNDRPLTAREPQALGEVVAAFDVGYGDGGREAIRLAARLAGKVQAFRSLGSAALSLAFVAAGRFEAYFHPRLACWDMAAAWCIATEAGARCTEVRGRSLSLDSGSILAASPRIHGEIMAALLGGEPELLEK